MKSCCSKFYTGGMLLSWLTFSATARAPELELWNHLMSTTGYNRNVRPILNDPSKQIDVFLVLVLARLDSLNEKAQVMTTFGWLAMTWKDELLTWEPEAFGGLDRLVVPAELIWLPEIAMMNSVGQGNDLSMTSKFRASIYHDGTVHWGPGFKLETSCTVDLVAFPYDTQECNVTFINWVYQAYQLNFSLINNEVNLESFEPNGEWDVVAAKASRRDYSPISELDIYVPTATFTLSLRRKSDFYEWNVLVPSIIMTFMSALVFCLPVESGEKIGLGITVLLSYSIVLLMVSDITPRTSSVPLITIYIVTSMGLTAFSLVSTVIIINVFHHNPRDCVPNWTKTALYNCLARCLCLPSNKNHSISASQTAEDPKNMHMGKKENVDDPIITNLDSYREKRTTKSEMEPREDLLTFLKNAKVKENDKDRIEKNQTDWHNLALMLDRLCLVIFCTVLFIVSFVMIVTMKK